MRNYRVVPEHEDRADASSSCEIGAAVDLSAYDASWYQPGGAFKRIVWYFCNHLFFSSWLPFPSGVKRLLLRAFGAEIGRGVVIKPKVNIKYPWFLRVADHVWIGEEVWIDNLAPVEIGSNVCLSQGAYLLTGNHNYKLSTFDLMTQPITIEAGVWVGAKAIVCPGVRLRSHSIITVGSVIQTDTQPFMIYTGNPAQPARPRRLTVRSEPVRQLLQGQEDQDIQTELWTGEQKRK